MTAATLLPEQALLVLSVLCCRPAASARLALLPHAALLCLCLLVRAASGGGALPLACLAATLFEIGVLWALGDRERRVERARSLPSVPLWPMGIGVLTVWLAYRLLPAGVAPLGAIALAVVLCGLVRLLFAPDDRKRWASLLFAGHGVLLFAGAGAGPGWAGLLAVLPLQAFVLWQVCARPVWTNRAEASFE